MARGRLPGGTVTHRRLVVGDVRPAREVPAALYLGADGATVRGAYRQLLVSTIQPLAQIIGGELERKLDTPVRFNFRRLATADAVARARAYWTVGSVRHGPGSVGTVVGVKRLGNYGL